MSFKTLLESKNKDNLVSPTEPNGELVKALIAYSVIVALVACFTYAFVGIGVTSAVVVGLITGQIFINLIFFPTRMSPFSDFGSSTAIYMLIQSATPVVVYGFAIVTAMGRKRLCPKITK